MKKLLGAASVALLITFSYALNITFQQNNIFYFLTSGSPFAKTERNCDNEVCHSMLHREGTYFSSQVYGTSECSDEQDCREKCLLDNTCEGYSQVDTYDKANPFPTSSQKYDGQLCSGDEDCRDKCIQDATCEGYSKYAYAIQTTYDYGAPHLSQSECAYNQPLKIYKSTQPLNRPAWNWNTASLTLMSDSITRGTPSYDATPLNSGNIRYIGCHIETVDRLSPNPKYTVLGFQSSAYSSWTHVQFVYGGHPNYITYYGVRKYYYYKYGQATPTPPSDKHEISYVKQFNAQKYLYGPQVALPANMQPVKHASKVTISGIQQESCFIPTQTDFAAFNTQYFNFPLQVTTDIEKPFGAILDLNELKAFYNLGSKNLFQNSIDCSNTLVCVCQNSMQAGTRIYRTGTSDVTDAFFTSENVNNILLDAYNKYLEKDAFVAHAYGSCELQSNIYDYYTKEECDMSGGIYLEPHDHIFDLLRHLTYISPSQIGNDVLKADNEVEFIHIIQPLLGNSNTNAYIHKRSLQKTFDDVTSAGLTFDEAARLCTDRCHKSSDCSYATVKADLSCALFKKCEGVQDGSSDNVKTFKKIGWSVSSKSTNGLTHKNHFYSIFPEQFLCDNYESGALLHKNIFESEIADTIFFGSTFTYIHENVQRWPSQSYIYHENGVWKGTLSPSKKYLKFDPILDTYAAHYMQADSSVGPKFGFEKYVDQCIYNFTKVECQAFANFNSYLINDLNLKDKGNIIYKSRLDDCPQNEITTQDQCMAYRQVINADGDVVDTNNHPPGCSILVDLTGARPSLVFFNLGSGENKQIGDTDEDGLVFQRLCYGNENRMFPKGCFMKEGTVNYNEDTVFSSCSLENKCFCSFAVPIMEIDGGLKEMLTDDTCAEVCSNTENCNFVQHHNDLCYGLEQCSVQNKYEFKLLQNWSDVQVSVTSARILVDNVTEETFFTQCASLCKNDGYFDDFFAVVRGNLLGDATYDIESTASPSNLTFVGLANSIFDCHFISGTKTIHFNRETSECYSADSGVTFKNSWNKQVKCYCLENQCPTCSSQEPFTDYSWKQIYEKKLVRDTVEDSKVIALENRTNYFPLFPYSGRWDCDADVTVKTSETECAEEAQKRDILVFAHNKHTQTCVLYNHFIDKAKTEILNHMENAKWCYKNNILRGNEGLITTYGTCARDVKRVERLKYKNCRVKQIDLLSSNTCLSWQTEQNVDFVSMGTDENKQYYNVAEAVNECIQLEHCNFIVQVYAFNKTVYELYTAKKKQYHFNSTEKTYSLVTNSCKGHADCEIKNMIKAKEGVSDPNVTQMRCLQYSNNNMIIVEDRTKPLGCFQENNQVYFNQGQQSASITDSFKSNVNYVQCQKFANDNGYTFATIAHNYALGSFFGADAYPQKCFIEISKNKVFYNYQTSKEVSCDRNIDDGICLYKSRIVRSGELCGGSESAYENMGSYSIQRYPNRYDCGYTYQWVEAQQYRNFADCVANDDHIWVENHNIENYNHLLFYYRNPSHPNYGQYVNVGASVRTWLYRDGSAAPNFEYTATNTLQNIRYAKEQNKCINLVYDPIINECSPTTECIKIHSYTYAIEDDKEQCYKSFFSEDCAPSRNSISLLTLPAYKVFHCEYDKTSTLINETVTSGKSMLQCQDACIYSNDCNTIEYNLDTKECKTGVLGTTGDGTNIVCQYNSDYQVYQQLVTKEECGEDAFTSHSNPSFSNYNTFMLGNIEYESGARDCVDCPAGQEPFSTTSYDCVENEKQNHFCVFSNLVNIETCALKDETGSGQREVTLQTCKEFCDATSCTVINFEETREDNGHCFLMTNQQKAVKENENGYLTCTKQFTARSCTPCPAGKYKPEDTHGRCLACKTGQFQDEPGQANCKACDAATYQNQIGQTHCETDLSYFGEISSMATITEEDELRYMQGTTCYHIKHGTSLSIMTKEECLAHANDKQLDFVEDHSHKLPANCSLKNNNNVVYNEPHGVQVIFDQDNLPTDEITRTSEECVEAANTNQILKFGERTTGQVTDNNVEITSGPNTLTLNYAECKQYAEDNSIPFYEGTYIETSQTPGCWNYNGVKVYYNHAITSVDCSTTYKCIQRPIQGLSLSDCELFQKLHYPSTQYGSMFYVVYSGPNIEFNRKMSEFECKQFTAGTRKSFSSTGNWANDPSGCITNGPTVWYNTAQTSHPCGHRGYYCVHKGKRFIVDNTASYPPGCYFWIPTQSVFYNRQDATGSCSLTDVKCVGVSYDSPPTDPVYKYAIVGANDESVDIDECRRFATINDLAWGGDTYTAVSGNPKGCFRYTSVTYFNHGTNTISCDATHLCIQKQEHQRGGEYDSPTDVPGCGVQQEIIEVSDSTLNLESLTYRECEEYADTKSTRFVGDVVIHLYYNQMSSGTATDYCSNKGYRLADRSDADLSSYQSCAAGTWQNYGSGLYYGYRRNVYDPSCAGPGWVGGYSQSSVAGKSPFCAEDPNDYGPAGCFLYNHPTKGQTYYFNANFQNTKKCDATRVTHCVKRQRRFTYNTNTAASGKCSDGKVNIFKLVNTDEKACVKSSTNGQPTAPLPNACSNKDYVQGCFNNVECDAIPGYTGITNLGIMNSMELCIQVAGNKGFKLATYHGKLRTCRGLIYDIEEDEADNIRNRRSSSLVTAINDTDKFVISIKTTDRMCGFGSAVGIANGPYQNNILSHLADETHGAFKKCDACQQFQVQTFEEACVSCDPGKHYSSAAGGVCLDCQAGYARGTSKKALRFFYNNDTKQEDIETYDLEVIHAGIDFNTYPGEYYSQFRISYNSLSRNFRCFACVPGRFAFADRSRECTRCPNGKYNNVWASANDCTNCPIGQFVNDFTKNKYVDMDGTLVEDGGHYMKSTDLTPCTMCSLGFFNTNLGASECDPCEEGSYQDNEGSYACKACQPGQFTNQKGSPACTACPIGFYENELGSRECKQCEQGTYQDNEGQTSCITCTGGKYQDEQQQTECKNCLPGTYTANGQPSAYYSICTKCEAGTYQQQSTQSSCYPCPKGTYGDTVESTVVENCKNCPAGRYGDTEATQGVNGCKGCPFGTYHWDTDQRKESINDCRVCPKGRYMDDDYVVVNTGNIPCKGCPKGRYNDVAGTRENHNNDGDCKGCTSGKYQDETGQEECKKCTPDGYGIGSSLTYLESFEGCDLCPQGKFSNIYHFQDPIMQANCAGSSNQLSITISSGQTCDLRYENLLCQDAQNHDFLCRNGKWDAVGSFTNNSPTCKDCPIGSYQDETGQKQCKSCGVDTQGFAGRAGAYQDQQGQKICKNTCDQVKPFQYIVDFASCRGGGGTQCSGTAVCYLIANPGFTGDWKMVSAMNYPTCAGPTSSSGEQVCHNIIRSEYTDSTHRHVDFRCKVCDAGDTKRVTPMLYSTRLESASSSSGSDST